MVEMRKKDRDDIERNRIHIRTIANLLHSILQVPKSSSSVDSVAVSQTPPAVGDIYETFVTSKLTVRNTLMETPAFSDMKDEEDVEGKVMTEVWRRTETWLVRI
jgi:hypothetical protein